MISKDDIIQYEARASWWMGRVTVYWLQYLTGIYLARKVDRKYARYLVSMDRQARVQRQRNAEQAMNRL